MFRLLFSGRALLPLFLLTIVASSMAASQRTLAVFTDVASSTGNTFTTGVVNIKLASTPASGTPTSAQLLDTVSAFIQVTAISPDASATPVPFFAGRLVVGNFDSTTTTDQAISFRYAVESRGTAVAGGTPEAQTLALGKYLNLEVGAAATAVTPDGTPAASLTCTTSSTIAVATPGTGSPVWLQIYKGPLTTQSNATGFGATAAHQLIGDRAQGATGAPAKVAGVGTWNQTGSMVTSAERTLAANQNDYLCFQLRFYSAGIDYTTNVDGTNGATSAQDNYYMDFGDAAPLVYHFDFIAEQTANN